MSTCYFEEEELPLNLQGWPWCAVCNKPVNRLIFSRTAESKEEVIIAICHDDKEIIIIPSKVIYTCNKKDKISLSGRAFEKKLLGEKSKK